MSFYLLIPTKFLELFLTILKFQNTCLPTITIKTTVEKRLLIQNLISKNKMTNSNPSARQAK